MWKLEAVVCALAIYPGVLGKEMVRNEIMAAELYDSGIMMDRIRTTKQV